MAKPLAASLILVVLNFSMAVTSCGRTQAYSHVDRSAALLEAVRQYGQIQQPSQAMPIKRTIDETPVPPITDKEEEYRAEIAADLVDKNFSQLEKEAHEDRVNKSRVVGGVWKLYVFYEALGAPIMQGATDADWEYHIGALKEWASAKPESAAARIALAETYVGYADKGRGTGYASTVSDTGWRLDEERTDLAASALMDAARLKEKCPYWYEAMQQVALSQGWDKAQAKELFERAVAFEPDYYHYYREYAYYLLPKWHGEPGEVEAFATDVYNRVGGQQGQFLYFEIASELTCQCDSADSDMENLSWPKIKEGYAALGQLYGYSNLKRNRFAHMAFEAGDKPAAQEAFAAIGDDWDHGVWRDSQRFETAKNWATSE